MQTQSSGLLCRGNPPFQLHLFSLTWSFQLELSPSKALIAFLHTRSGQCPSQPVSPAECRWRVEQRTTSVFARSLSAWVQLLSLLWFHVYGDTATVTSISPSSINSDPGALHRTRASLIMGFSFFLKSQDFSLRLLHHGFFCVSLLVEPLSAGLQVPCHRAAL